MKQYKVETFANSFGQFVEIYTNLDGSGSRFFAVTDVIVVIPPGLPMKDTIRTEIESATDLESAFAGYEATVEKIKKEAQRPQVVTANKTSKELILPS